MKLAINYSPAAAALYQEERIQCDYFKCPPWPWMVSEAEALAPVAVHFGLRAGAGKLHQTDWAKIDHFRARTGTNYVNLHLEPDQADFPGLSADVPDPNDERRVIDTLLADIWAVVEHFGAECVIVENVIYSGPQGRILRPATEPEIIRRIVEETGCGLLFDISHARVSAHHFGLDEFSYIQQFPMHRLSEMHFAGIHKINGELQDHLSALPGDWQALDWALENIQRGEWSHPHMLAFEYGGVGGFFENNCDPMIIAEQMPILWEKVKM